MQSYFRQNMSSSMKIVLQTPPLAPTQRLDIFTPWQGFLWCFSPPDFHTVEHYQTVPVWLFSPCQLFQPFSNWIFPIQRFPVSEFVQFVWMFFQLELFISRSREGDWIGPCFSESCSPGRLLSWGNSWTGLKMMHTVQLVY